MIFKKVMLRCLHKRGSGTFTSLDTRKGKTPFSEHPLRVKHYGKVFVGDFNVHFNEFPKEGNDFTFHDRVLL